MGFLSYNPNNPPPFPYPHSAESARLHRKLAETKELGAVVLETCSLARTSQVGVFFACTASDCILAFRVWCELRQNPVEKSRGDLF